MLKAKADNQRNYSGYMGFVYRENVKDNLKAGLTVQESIRVAHQKMKDIPKLVIED